MIKRWKLTEENEDQVNNLHQKLKINRKLCQVLVNRGITTYDEAQRFFRPSLKQLNDPFLMKDMEEAVLRIEKAIEGEEKILVYGDYDVDGTTAVSLVYSFFKELYGNIDYYIPDRYKEGYGISFQGVDFAADNDFKLIIALDCGIKAMGQIDHANKLGVDFIICDHHLPGDELPAAHAVLDPKRSDCEYPYKELSGCGIGFKLIEAYAQKNDISFEKVEQMLDLLVVSIAADIVPITGENRVLAYFGLERLNNDPRHGFRSMIELAALERRLTITDIVFIIGPRINAAGRMDDAKNAVRLLISDDTVSADGHAITLQNHNTERKDIDREITEEALSMIRNDKQLLNSKTTVVYNPDWHKGVIGIVASRLMEEYYRPTIVLTRSNGVIAGSARSVRGFDIHHALEQCSDLLEQFGGHKYAAGMTLDPEKLESFKIKFEEVVANSIPEELLTPEIIIDAELESGHFHPNFYNIIKQMEPFGPGNMKPVFITTGVQDCGTRIVKEDHL
ncbi:MAG: single-stranded-DNA-specific exonuclease RecJ, partial [Bacteroidetes bacterium]|nr:single-stranded-DNA-specific exonuclease RecJ [Bacteroidota bacterium]